MEMCKVDKSVIRDLSDTVLKKKYQENFRC